MGNGLDSVRGRGREGMSLKGKREARIRDMQRTSSRSETLKKRGAEGMDQVGVHGEERGMCKRRG